MTTAEKNEAIVSAPGTITLGGQTYLVGKPTESDLYTMVQHCRRVAKRLKSERRDTKLSKITEDLKGLSPKLQEVAVRAAVQADDAVTEEDLGEVVTGVVGCQFLAWLLIRKKHQSVTLEQIAACITDANADQVYADLDEASGMGQIKKGFQAAGFSL